MSRRRKEIRKAVVKALSGKTAAKKNVRANRGEINEQDLLPAVNVYFRGETCEDYEEAPRRLKRLINMEIELIDRGVDGENISDKLDDLAEEVEDFLSRDDTLDKTCDDIILTSISDVDVSTEGAEAFGSLKLYYQVTYHEFSPRDRKGQNISDLDGIDAEYNLQPGQDEADRANDKIDF